MSKTVSFFSMRHLAHAEIKAHHTLFSQQLHPQSGSLPDDHFWLNLSRPETIASRSYEKLYRKLYFQTVYLTGKLTTCPLYEEAYAPISINCCSIQEYNTKYVPPMLTKMPTNALFVRRSLSIKIENINKIIGDIDMIITVLLTPIS